MGADKEARSGKIQDPQLETRKKEKSSWSLLCTRVLSTFENSLRASARKEASKLQEGKREKEKERINGLIEQSMERARSEKALIKEQRLLSQRFQEEYQTRL